MKGKLKEKALKNDLFIYGCFNSSLGHTDILQFRYAGATL